MLLKSKQLDDTIIISNLSSKYGDGTVAKDATGAIVGDQRPVTCRMLDC